MGRREYNFVGQMNGCGNVIHHSHGYLNNEGDNHKLQTNVHNLQLVKGPNLEKKRLA